jgi:hypothetical protein
MMWEIKAERAETFKELYDLLEQPLNLHSHVSRPPEDLIRDENMRLKEILLRTLILLTKKEDVWDHAGQLVRYGG